MNEDANKIIESEETPSKKRKKKEKPVLSETEIKLRKARKTRISVAAFVLLLGIGVMGNWYYENTDLSSKIEPLINSSQTKTLGEAEYVDATTEISTEAKSSENEYFSSARVERQTARDESLDKLQSIIDSTEESDEAQKDAAEQIAKISSYISIENKIETLVTAKGVNNCLAVISDDGSRVDVIVDVDELSDSVILQIKEIAIEQLGCSFEDVSIIQSK
ncbi:MAG: SpoIIIAH-like family protein [Eubacterium sp.]